MRHQVGVEVVKRIGKFAFCRDGLRGRGGIPCIRRIFPPSYMEVDPIRVGVHLHVRERKLASNAWCIFSLNRSLGPLSPFFFLNLI